MSKLWKLLVICFSLWSCNNEIKIAAPWKETIVVYGLLDPAASVNYIRIQKAFLDPEGNAFQFVQINDSIYPTNLEVKLFVRKNGAIIDTLFPQLVNGDNEGIKKDTGLFQIHLIIYIKLQTEFWIHDSFQVVQKIMNTN